MRYDKAPAIVRDAIAIDEPPRELRAALRASTRESHDRLDAAMRDAGGWATLEDYGRFLSLQYAARQPVEDWLETHAPPHLCPPRQTPLIARDLAALRAPLPDKSTPFAAPVSWFSHADLAALGVAWVLAGSSLGNIGIAKEVEREGDGAWPDTFLSHPAMLEFWRDLRPVLEQPVTSGEAHAASAAATTVFDHFLSHIGRRAGENSTETMVAT